MTQQLARAARSAAVAQPPQPAGFVDLLHLGDIAYKANSPAQLRVEMTGVNIRALFVEVIGTLDITTTTDGTLVTRNPGTLVENFQIVLPDGTIPVWGRLLDFEDRAYVWTYGGPKVTPDTLAANASESLACFHIPFNAPWSKEPYLTALDMNWWREFIVNIQYGDENRIVKKGALTVEAWSVEPKLRIWAEITRDKIGPRRQMFVQRFQETDSLGTAANAALRLRIPRGPSINYHSLILVAEDDTGSGFVNRAKVSTVLNNVYISQRGEKDYPSNLLQTPMTGSILQYEFSQRFDRNLANLTGIYPIMFSPRMDGLMSYSLKTEDMTDLDLYIDHSGFTTKGYIRLLTQHIENIRF